MIPDGTPVGPLAKLIPLVTLSAKESRTALLDNTEEAACTIDFVDDPVNTQNIKVCTEQTFAPTADTDNFLDRNRHSWKYCDEEILGFCSQRGKNLPCALLPRTHRAKSSTNKEQSVPF